MDSEPSKPEEKQSDALTAALIRFALIVFIVVICLRVFAPFLPIMLWALVLAVALYPLQVRLERWVGGASGRAATVLVFGGLLLIGVPSVMLGSSFAEQIFDLHEAFVQGKVVVPAPSPEIAEWPLIGAQVHEAWHAAATDLPAYLETLQPQLANKCGSH